MATEVWFRNPGDYIRELIEAGATKLAWDRGTAVKFRADPVKYTSLHYGKDGNWRILFIGGQGAVNLLPGDTIQRNSGVFPVWQYGDSESNLEDLLANPVGDSRIACTDERIAPDERPKYGQEHRVVIIGANNSSTGIGKEFLYLLSDLQKSYPDAIIHLHGPYSWNIAFGSGVRSADVFPRYDAQKGRVILPSGKRVVYETMQNNPKWALALGFNPVDLRIPRNRCIYNIKSALWAGDNYDRLIRLPGKAAKKLPVDISTPSASYSRPESKIIGTRGAKEGDKFLCDVCSVQLNCSFFRSGAVCAVPGSEPKPLAAYFNTRDSNQIIAGLGLLMQTQTRRLERGLETEEEEGLQPEVTKIINGLIDRGMALAKLVDPTLRKPEVNVNVGSNNTTTILNASPQAIMASVVSALEARGVSRDQITPVMVANLLESMKNQASIPMAIEGTVVSIKDRERAG